VPELFEKSSRAFRDPRGIARRVTFIASRIRAGCFDPYSVLSFSQGGEDLLLDELFSSRPTGFYVDVGAHHPRRFSNTHLFHSRGWRGVNIDASAESVKLFRRERPKDINAEAAVASLRKPLTLFVFQEGALNSLDPDLSRSRVERGESPLVETRQVITQTLSDLLDEHLPPEQSIDFLSVDVEGLDLDVLKSNNWERFRPQIVLAEQIGGGTVAELASDPMHEYLSGVGYVCVAKTIRTLFFQDAKA